MESLVRLDSYDPRIREYLLKHRYPVILEVFKTAISISVMNYLILIACSEQALLTGLSIMMPHDPWEFVLEKLQKLKDSGGSAVLHWSANFFFFSIPVLLAFTRIIIKTCMCIQGYVC